jgi:hypothetical protein
MKKNKFIWFIILGVILIGALWVGSWFLIDLNIENPTNRGTFGDKFGAINSLFSGLAFLGLIVTLLFQKEELELQRQELSETRKELEGQKKEFQEQNKIMRRQSFENTLFNMLSLQQEIVNKLSFSGIKNTLDLNTNFFGGMEVKVIPEKIDLLGRSVFEELYNEVEVTYVNINGKEAKEDGIKNILNKRIDFYSQIKETTLFDHYFRHLYRIFKYIKESDLIAEEEKYEYSCIVRSQLSDYELVMLFYNCISVNGKDKFKPLIEEYAIFNNIRTELLIDSSDKTYYLPSAYSKNKS